MQTPTGTVWSSGAHACPQDTLASPARLRRRAASRARPSSSGRAAPYPASPQGARGQERHGAAAAAQPAGVCRLHVTHQTYKQDPKSQADKCCGRGARRAAAQHGGSGAARRQERRGWSGWCKQARGRGQLEPGAQRRWASPSPQLCGAAAAPRAEAACGDIWVCKPIS